MDSQVTTHPAILLVLDGLDVAEPTHRPGCLVRPDETAYRLDVQATGVLLKAATRDLPC
jgi:hypothetical protein